MTMRRAWFGPLALLVLALLAGAPAGALPGGVSQESWWILLDERPERPGEPWDDPALDATARACGLDPYTVQSAGFLGREGGRILVVHLRAYPTKAEARAALKTARRCVRGARLMRGRLVVE